MRLIKQPISIRKYVNFFLSLQGLENVLITLRNFPLIPRQVHIFLLVISPHIIPRILPAALSILIMILTVS